MNPYCCCLSVFVLIYISTISSSIASIVRASRDDATLVHVIDTNQIHELIVRHNVAFQALDLSTNCYWDALRHVNDYDLDGAISELTRRPECFHHGNDSTSTSSCELTLKSHDDACHNAHGHVCMARMGIYDIDNGNQYEGAITLPYCLPNTCINFNDLRYWMLNIGQCDHSNPGKRCDFMEIRCEQFNTTRNSNDDEFSDNFTIPIPNRAQSQMCMNDMQSIHTSSMYNSLLNRMSQSMEKCKYNNLTRGSHDCTESTTNEFEQFCIASNGHICNLTSRFYIGHEVIEPICLAVSCANPIDLALILADLHSHRTNSSRGHDYALIDLKCPPQAPSFRQIQSSNRNLNRADTQIEVKQVVMRLNIDISSIVDIDAFQSQILDELNGALNVDRDRLSIASITSGSVILKIHIYPLHDNGEPTHSDIIDELERQLNTKRSPITFAYYMSRVQKPISISTITLKQCVDGGEYQLSCTDSSSSTMFKTIVVAIVVGCIVIIATIVFIIHFRRQLWMKSQFIRGKIPTSTTQQGRHADDIPIYIKSDDDIELSTMTNTMTIGA